MFQKGFHVDGQMMGTKAGSRELLQDVVNKAMEPERCACVHISNRHAFTEFNVCSMGPLGTST